MSSICREMKCDAASSWLTSAVRVEGPLAHKVPVRDCLNYVILYFNASVSHLTTWPFFINGHRAEITRFYHNVNGPVGIGGKKVYGLSVWLL